MSERVSRPKCGKRIKLLKSGLLWKHRESFSVDPRYRPKICPSSGESPYRAVTTPLAGQS